jgi:hypothetical protein
MDESGEHVFDASDVTWPGLEGATFTHLIVGGFEIRLGPDGGELLADDDALVIPLDQRA